MHVNDNSKETLSIRKHAFYLEKKIERKIIEAKKNILQSFQAGNI